MAVVQVFLSGLTIGLGVGMLCVGFWMGAPMIGLGMMMGALSAQNFRLANRSQ